MGRLDDQASEPQRDHEQSGPDTVEVRFDRVERLLTLHDELTGPPRKVALSGGL